MEEFRMIAPVLSLILGLGVTRLLLGFVTVFRIRATAPVDWLPLTWAAVLFVEQIEFWWAISGLSIVRSGFTFLDFLILITLPLLLFLSGALILPNRAEDESQGLRSYFERDGRFGLLPFVLYLLMAIMVDTAYFQAPLFGLAGALNLLMAVATATVFLSRNRWVQAVLTVAVPILMLVGFSFST